MSATQQLVHWAWELRLGDIPESARQAARRHLTDGVGCALAAHRLGVVEPALAVARRYSHPAEATILGSGERVAAPYAALANGALVHGLDFDDTHADALVHATAAVLPALLAAGDRTRSTDAELLVAAVAGYELVLRLGAAVPHGFHARGFHATSVCGVFAATLIAARLSGLTKAQAVDALGIAGSLAAGSLEFLDTDASTKQLHPGLAAQAGITAAELAAAGAHGPATILEGRYGLFTSYVGERAPTSRLAHGLGQTWEVERITLKPYPVCQLSHASMDAVAAVRTEVDLDQITSVTVRVPQASVPIVCEPRGPKVTPRSAYEAKFSLPWCVAAVLVDGAVTVETFSDVASRTDIAALAAKVRYEEYSYDEPPATAPGDVTIDVASGRGVVGMAAAGRTLSEDEVLAKFRANAGAGSDEIADRWLRLGAKEDVSARS